MRAVARSLLVLLIVGLAAGKLWAQTAPTRVVTNAEYESWKKDLSNWGRWGKDDQIGALNLITPAKRKAAAGLVKEGYSVSLAGDADTVQAVDNPNPYDVKMLAIGNDHPQYVSPSYLRAAVHDFALLHLGVHLFDNCDLEALADAAAARERWDFLLTAAPLPIRGGTGSPANPIATF